MKSPNQIAIEALTEARDALTDCMLSTANEYPAQLALVNGALAALSAPPAQGSIDTPIPTWQERMPKDMKYIGTAASEMPYLLAEIADLRAARQSAAPGELLKAALTGSMTALQAADIHKAIAAPAPSEPVPFIANFGTGCPPKEWTPEAEAKLDAVLAEYPPVPQGVPEGWRELVERTIDRLSKAQIFDLVTAWRKMLAAPTAPTATSGGEAVASISDDMGFPDVLSQFCRDCRAGNALVGSLALTRYIDQWRALAPPSLPAASDAASVRKAALEEAAKACESEAVEKTGTDGDVGYNMAIRHAADAIRALISKEAGQ